MSEAGGVPVRRRRTGLAVALFLVAGVFGPGAWGGVELSAGQPVWHLAVIAAVLLPSACVAAALALRIPGNPIGWLLLATVTGAAVGAAAGHWAEYHPGAHWSDWAAWVSAVLWALGPPVLPLIVLVFPDGRSVGRAGKWGVRLGVAGAGLLALGSALLPGRLADQSSSPGPSNPAGVPAFGALRPVLLPAVVILLALAAVLGAVTLLQRWRRGVGAERLALACAGAPLVVALGLDVAAHAVGLGGAAVVAAAGLVAAIGVPAGIWLAVTRYRLYNIDLVIARTLGYALLAVGLAVLFGLTAVLAGLAAGRGSPVATAIAAAVTATALGPARRRVLAAVQRSLLGPAGDPERAAAWVARRLAAVGDPDELSTAAAAAVAQALRLDGVVVLPLGNTLSRPLNTVCPLTHLGVEVGVLGLGGPSTPAVRRALGRVSEPVAAAMHAAGLSEAVRRSRSELVGAVEDERRRLRRDLHDGLGPRLATLAMGLDAVGNRMAGMPNGTGAAEAVARLRAQTDLMLGDLRRIVTELRPPALDELGLVGALRLRASEVAEPAGLAVEVVAEDVGHLAAAVEVAAYRIAAEAMLNAARHSDGRRCRLTLACGDGLRLTVTDDGRGIATGSTVGVGTQSMRERAAALGGWVTVGPATHGGTEVRAWLPAAPA
jgi:two-component system NarL family sensor kinase